MSSRQRLFLMSLRVCASLDFDFPKIHSLQHYIPSFKLFGSLRNISTDIGERLHIDLIKNGYKATNKKKGQYPKQICELLNLRESMSWLAHHQAHLNGTLHDERKRVDTRQHDAMEFARTPADRRTLQELANLYAADGIEAALHSFLLDYIDTEWHDPDANRRGDAPSVPWLSPHLKFPVWHRINFYTPDLQTVAAKETRDVAYAVPRRLRSRPDEEGEHLEARFSPVFVKEGGELAGEGGTDGEHKRLSCCRSLTPGS